MAADGGDSDPAIAAAAVLGAAGGQAPEPRDIESHELIVQSPAPASAGTGKRPSRGSLKASTARKSASLDDARATFAGVDLAKLEALMEKREPRLLDDLGGGQALAERLKSDVHSGLAMSLTDAEEVQDGALRTQMFGRNTHPPPKKKSLFEFMWDAVTDTTLLVLIAAAITDLAVGIYKATSNTDKLGWINGIAILIAVVVIVLVNSVNDYRKQAQFLQLSSATDSLERVTAIRSGKPVRILTTSITVGDVLVVDPGDILAADGVLLSGNHLVIDESALTGEAKPVKKSVDGDSLLISGCRVSDGKGRMLVLCIGDRSTNGKMLALLRSADDEDEDMTPLQERLEKFATILSKGGLALAIVFVVALFVVYGATKAFHDKSTVQIVNDCIDIVITGITVVVIAVPEGLPVAVVLSLGFTTLLMLRDGNLVRHLAACETMGSATTICSDKTGTLTQNRMTVVKGLVGASELGPHNSKPLNAPPSSKSANEILPILARSININSTAFKSSKPAEAMPSAERVHYIGSPSEGALLDWTETLGMPFEVDRAAAQIVDLVPFSSSRKRMVTVAKMPHFPDTSLFPSTDGELWVFSKGAAESIVDLCDNYVGEDCQIVKMTPAARSKFHDTLKTYTSTGLRTLAFAAKRVKEHTATDLASFSEADPTAALPVERGATLLAILGIEDPVRQEVPGAVATCSRAGIVVRMVTGDSLSTAVSIAERCGILTEGAPRTIVTADGGFVDNGEGAVVLEGSTFRALDPQTLKTLLPRLRVLARSSPADKQQLVKHLQELGDVVAVTGDGTNDAAALRSSDVGFSMGIAGTATAKEASDIVILDDNFATLVKAVVWGRGVYASIQKFVQFQLTVNVTAVAITIVSSFISTVGGNPVSVLNVVQLLWINLIQDTFAALALATDAPRDDVLDQRPVARDDPLVTEDMWRLIGTQSVYQIVVSLGLFLKGEDWFGLVKPDGAPVDLVLSSLVFNAFVWCNIFNLFNCRVTNREFNVFRDMFKNRILLFIVSMQIVVQIIIVEVGGEAFKTAPLSIIQWAICIGLGAGSLVFGQIVRLIPSFGSNEQRLSVARDNEKREDA